MESSHRWKHIASTPQVAGHRIKSSEPLTRDSAAMSPARLGSRRSTFNYIEDTLEIARLHINPAHCSSRKRQSRAGTAAISRSQPKDYPHRRTLSRFCCIAWFALLCHRPEPFMSRGVVIDHNELTAV